MTTYDLILWPLVAIALLSGCFVLLGCATAVWPEAFERLADRVFPNINEKKGQSK